MFNIIASYTRPFAVRFHSGFNFTFASLKDIDTYQKIVETFKFSYALRTYLGDEMFTNVSEVCSSSVICVAVKVHP